MAQLNPSDYKIMNKKGEGTFGVVFEAIGKDNKKVAIKRIHKVSNIISRELTILKQLSDIENVVQLLQVFYTKQQQEKIQNLVFEFIPHDLERLIQKKKTHLQKIDPFKIKHYIYCVLKGLSQIHSLGIAHRDLKPENILYDDEEGHVKICDFGSAKKLEENGKNTPHVVSCYYRAPELLLCVTKYTTAIDIWAVGCILSELVTLKVLFDGEGDGHQIFRIMEIKGKMNEEEIEWYCKNILFKKKIFDVFPESQMQDFKEMHKDFKGDLDDLVDLLEQEWNNKNIQILVSC